MSSNHEPGPLTQSIAAALRDLIETGDYKQGDALPSFGDLAEGFSVSKYTAREAMKLLQCEGLVYIVPGEGTIVAGKISKPATPCQPAAGRKVSLSGNQLYIDGIDFTRSLTTAEAAEILDVHFRTVEVWGNSGVLAFFRTPGRQKRFSATQVEDLVRKRQQNGSARRSHVPKCRCSNEAYCASTAPWTSAYRPECKVHYPDIETSQRTPVALTDVPEDAVWEDYYLRRRRFGDSDWLT